MKYIDQSINFVIVISGLLLSLIMIVQVLLRYVLNGGFLGIEELAVLFGVWFYFLGIAQVTNSNEHIRGGIAELFIKTPVGLNRLSIIDSLFISIVNIIFLWYGVQYFISTIVSNQTSTYMEWPIYLWTLSMVVGFLLSTISSSTKLINTLFKGQNI